MILSPYEEKRIGRTTLSQSDIQYFRQRYGKRFIRALRAVEEDRVVQYHFLPSDSTTWIVQGSARQYLTIPDTYCTCRSFYQDVVIAGEYKFCYHLLAQSIAETRDQFITRESNDAQRRVLYDKWRRTD